MKTILVPVDFSGGCQKALEYAIDLASKAEAGVLVCHIYELTAVMPGFAEVMMREVQRETQQKLDRFLAGVDPKDVVLETIVREGSIVSEICRTVEEFEVSLIVMGTGGGKNLVKKIFGTTTEAVARRGMCPVIAIPEHAAIKPIEHIVYAADMESGDELTVAQLMQFKRLFNSTITFLHVNNDDQPDFISNEFIKENLLQMFPEADLRFVEVENKHVAKGISDYVLANDTSLLAFSMIERHILEKIGHTSVVARLLHNLRIPMLALPENGILLDLKKQPDNKESVFK